MKISEEFKLARVLIENYEDSYICYALQHSVKYKNDPTPTPAMRVIKDRLNGHFCLESWVYAKVGYKVWDNNKTKTMKATRLAWLDSLIAEFEAKGK